MSALAVNFKITHFQDMLDEIDAHTAVLKDEYKEEHEYIRVYDLKRVLENHVGFDIIDLDKI